jgi:DNA-binding NtrC family response regulator
MPNLILTDEQAIQLVEQLPQQQQAKLMQVLLQKSWSKWLELSQSGQVNIRQIAADKNKNWDEMNKDEQKVLIDEILRE